MEPVLKQLRELGRRFNALSSAVRFAILGAAAVVILIVVLTQVGGSSSTYEYAFTNLSAEDSSEAAAQLKAAKVPFRLEAGGTALAVPSAQVYDARLMLAAMGLPRGGGVGFEIFDRGDLGVSEFTQRVNLRRAIEGELGRTIGRLASVRSARVHITLPEKGLYRDDDHKAIAAVVLNLQPGRTMTEKELQGVRHLVASAVTGLNPESVTVVDGSGTVLAGDSSADAKAATQQRDTERSLEQRILDLLEPAVGAGAVVAKVTAAFDNADVETTADAYDPDATAVRSEHKTNELTNQEGPGASGVAGAAANQPGAAVPGGGTGTNKGTSQREDETRNYEVSKTVTHTVARGPRLKRLSIAVLVDAPGGKLRGDAELKKLEDLSKSAVGFDVRRGDQFQISSAAFSKAPGEGDAPRELWWSTPRGTHIIEIVAALALLLALAGAGTWRVRVRKRKAAELAAEPATALLKPGAKVAEIEAAMDRAALPPKAGAAGAQAALPAVAGANGAIAAAGTNGAAGANSDPNAQIRDRARELAASDPQRAAQLLKAWINFDTDRTERVEARRG
jgi:flagellar M-ring protein FliF